MWHQFKNKIAFFRCIDSPVSCKGHLFSGKILFFFFKTELYPPTISAHGMEWSVHLLMSERLAKKQTNVTVQSGALASHQKADARWFGWKVRFSRQMVVPTLYCSQQGLWMILSNWVMISGKRHYGGVFRTYFILSYNSEKPQVECHPAQLYLREDRQSLHRRYRQNSHRINRAGQTAPRLQFIRASCEFLFLGSLCCKFTAEN